MRIILLRISALLALTGTAAIAVAQNAAIANNTWTNGAPMPTGVWFPGAVAVINDEIWIAGGETGYANSLPVSDTQIYNPATNTWRVGPRLPTPLSGGSSAVINGVWYVLGGSTDGVSYTNLVWAYDLKAGIWLPRSPMPIGLHDAGAVVFDDMIYVVGGNSEQMYRANTLECYNPAADTWTELAPMLTGKSEPSVGIFRTVIMAADGDVGDEVSGDNEAYDVNSNQWKSLAADPTPRNAACAGTIGPRLFVAGGSTDSEGSLSLTEFFDLLTNSWTTLAPMPQATQIPAAAVYHGRLYCLGGGQTWPDGPVYNAVQIYHP